MEIVLGINQLPWAFLPVRTASQDNHFNTYLNKHNSTNPEVQGHSFLE